MPRWTLQPVRILCNFFVSDSREAPEEVNWAGLVQKLGTPNDASLMAKSLSAVTGSYIGQINSNKGVVNFVLINPNSVGDFEWLDQRDSTFRHRIVKIYRVERFEREGKIEEIGSSRP